MLLLFLLYNSKQNIIIIEVSIIFVFLFKIFYIYTKYYSQRTLYTSTISLKEINQTDQSYDTKTEHAELVTYLNLFDYP